MIIYPIVEDIIKVMTVKNYRIFKGKGDYNLNIVGIRTSSIEANTFDDWLTVFYMLDSKWIFFAFPATTDPGTYYRLNPVNVRGTAVLKPGQYRNAYMIGKHRGYKALQQKKSVVVYRDANRDVYLDTSGITEDRGLFGINIHRSNAYRASLKVGKWSAGCQVIQDPYHFNFLITLCDKSRELYGNSFTYTLLEESDFIK